MELDAMRERQRLVDLALEVRARVAETRAAVHRASTATLRANTAALAAEAALDTLVNALILSRIFDGAMQK